MNIHLYIYNIHMHIYLYIYVYTYTYITYGNKMEGDVQKLMTGVPEWWVMNSLSFLLFFMYF